ncbi:thiosulfate-binding protein [Candidatus Blochmanniella vafra str. BVAF]|uniref:Thiosulfate-binding protein n=1 Tax=Blochmanniella vafra (strain BVAF) TaxID=859654 RepID=E8Q773_BLOVB|nr:thiosulfate ABC transporter substrate-binding protein CysP [Candidatus Blochmannia vafer]ADV33897.1 thiosulfate-binding protein [Candidatus Blochmannia vafer str. BVAF]
MIIIAVVYRIIKITILLLYCLICTSVYSIILLNSSYDVSRELFSEINSNFILYWKNIHPEDKLIIRQSHSGSTRQAIAILQGLRADVVTYNQIIDVQILHDRGQLIPKDWQNRLPNRSSPFYSTMSFLVRQGNPKSIYNWNDLTQDGLKIVFPNPRTSGNGRYTYLAAWVAFLKSSNNNIELTRSKMKKVLKNVMVFDSGGRSSTITFVDRDQGDVLINFESESKFIKNQFKDNNYEIIIPDPNILVEFPVTWIDKNVVRNGTQNIAKAYLEYLYTDAARKIISKFGYRVNVTSMLQINRSMFPVVHLFTVEEQYGADWNNIMKIHFRRGGELDQLLSSVGKD